MNRTPSALPAPSSLLVEALEPRIAPAGLLNESKFTSVVVGGTVLLDASGGPNDFQGLTTGFGGASGTYLLYLTTGKALVYTTDLNGNGRFDAGEVTGISLGVDSLGRAPSLTLFTDVHGDIVTNLLPGHGVSALTDSDNNPTNGRDGRVLLPTNIDNITIRPVNAADLDNTIVGNTVANRVGLTSFSIYGTIYCGGDFGGLTINTVGSGAVLSAFNGSTGTELAAGSIPQVGGIVTGTAADGHQFHFTQNATGNIEGTILPFKLAAGQHGGDISNITAGTSQVFSIGTIDSGAGGAGGRGGNISNVTMHGDTGSYEIIAGDGGPGATGGPGGSIFNFTDLGTTTGQVILHTGAGGDGSLGAGGVGGTATFGSSTITAGVKIFLGAGGNGFGSGGDGAGLASGVFDTQTALLPLGGTFIGTWHDIGDVGNTHPNDAAGSSYSPEVLDFDGDGHGDGVLTTTRPDQVIVVFGSDTGQGYGVLQDNGGSTNVTGAKTVTLNVPGVVNPVVTIGDFNGDGRPDIAVASRSASNFSGVYVFLDQIGTALDPINNHNFSQSAIGDHPFSNALQTALPSLTDAFLVFNGPSPVIALTSGDYNGDGITDIGVAQIVTTILAGVGPKEEVVGMIFGGAAHDSAGNLITHVVNGQVRTAGTGFFHANSAPPGAASTLQYTSFLGTATPILESTSLTSGNGPGSGGTTGAPGALVQPEIIVYGVNGDDHITVVAADVDTVSHQPNSLFSFQLESLLGFVDTNRTAPATPGGTTPITPVKVTLQDYVIVDGDNDGVADVVALTKTPAGYLVGLQGGGDGFFGVATAGDPPFNDRGTFLGMGTTPAPPTLALRAIDVNGDGLFSEFAVLQFPAIAPTVQIEEVSVTATQRRGSIFDSPTTPFIGRILTTGALMSDQSVLAFDAFYVNAPGVDLHPLPGYGLISPTTTDIDFDYLAIFSYTDYTGYLPSYIRSYTENGYLISAGHGGGSTVGSGGNGGTLGTSTLNVASGATATGAIEITFPEDIFYSGVATLEAGYGGSGFSGGGNGGSVEGLLVRYDAAATVLTSSAFAAAGDGGNSVAGNGGAGGSVADVSVATGVFFSSGNGGNGVNGGASGNIVGNNSTVYDTTSGNIDLSISQALAIGFISPAEAATDSPGTTFAFFGVALSAGHGGQGSATGALGGMITNWHSGFNPVIGGTGGGLYYASGAGGSAAAGAGGAGGSVNNSGPDPQNDNLAGNLHVQAGSGGEGLQGGDGGSIATFINQPTGQTAVAGELYIRAGDGGIGVVSSGGVGGSITGFQSNATGLSSAGLDQLTGVGLVIAGNGGNSYAAEGGNGGSIGTSLTTSNRVIVQTTSTPIVVSAGVGGSGLTVGGEGGSVVNASVNSAAQQVGKILVVAGMGGDATAALTTDISLPGDPNTGDLAHIILAFGNVSARAGDGGNITSLTQPISTQTAVDLIAGNGGSTANAGSSLDTTTGVGRGGSVTDVNLTGTVGAISRNTSTGVIDNPPIQAYAASYVSVDAFGDSTFTTTTLPITNLINLIANPNNTVNTLNDNVPADPNAFAFGTYSISGNVGIVAGAAGRVRNGQPARDGINGSVQNIAAESIMSIVAGSVTSVAPVNVLSGITITDPDGVLGVDRSPMPIALANGQLSYPPNGQLDYFDQSGNHVTNLQAGYSLVGPGSETGDGALFAINIVQTTGATLRGPRVFSINGS